MCIYTSNYMQYKHGACTWMISDIGPANVSYRYKWQFSYYHLITIMTLITTSQKAVVFLQCRLHIHTYIQGLLVHTNTCKHTDTTHTHTHKHTHTHTSTHTHTQAHIHAHAHTHTARTCAQVHTHAHTLVLHVYIQYYMYIYKCAHLHTQSTVCAPGYSCHQI